MKRTREKGTETKKQQNPQQNSIDNNRSHRENEIS